MAKLYKGKLSRNDNDEKNVEGITAKTVRPEGSICELSSDIKRCATLLGNKILY